MTRPKKSKLFWANKVFQRKKNKINNESVLILQITGVKQKHLQTTVQKMLLRKTKHDKTLAHKWDSSNSNFPGQALIGQL